MTIDEVNFPVMLYCLFSLCVALQKYILQFQMANHELFVNLVDRIYMEVCRVCLSLLTLDNLLACAGLLSRAGLVSKLNSVKHLQ